MSLFDVPHPAQVDSKHVLWFGVVVLDDPGRKSDEAYAIVANPSGRITLEPLQNVIADVRHVTEREGIIAGQTGPGWVDLEDLEATMKDTAGKLVESLTQKVVEELAKPEPAATNAMVEGTDYVTDKEGNWYDPVTGKELDKSTGQPIE